MTPRAPLRAVAAALALAGAACGGDDPVASAWRAGRHARSLNPGPMARPSPFRSRTIRVCRRWCCLPRRQSGSTERAPLMAPTHPS